MPTETPKLNPDLASLSPAMRQYRSAKEAYPDCLLFFRMGDFYELFYEDAIVAARELQLTLTARDKAKSVPMCGVPYHAAEAYLQRLLRKGYRVAICEQMEDPKLAKTVVRREVTRVMTPGTAIDPSLGAEQSNYLASIAATGTGASTIIGLALLDLSTGEFRATEFRGEGAKNLLIDEVSRVRPVELLFGSSGALFKSRETPLKLDREQDDEEYEWISSIKTKTPLDEWVFSAEHALPVLRHHFHVHSLDGLGFATHETAAVGAGALLHYLQSTKQGDLQHVDTLRFYERTSCLELDAVSVRNLELIEPLFSGETAQTTLFYTVDACCTPMGKRLLRSVLMRPSNDLVEIEARLDAVGEAVGNLKTREAIRRAMSGVLDMERLLARIAMDSAGPREVLAVAATLACLPALATAMTAFKANRWLTLADGFDTLSDLEALIRTTMVDEPPMSLSDGNVIRPGVDAELDELRELSRSGRQALVAIEERERARTGIASLKVRFNNVFGYYIEVTKANAKGVPSDYERKQTLVNAERFTTPELKEYETKILTAQERSSEIERRLFFELRRKLLDAASRIRGTARRVAEIDLLSSFAHISSLHGWVRPSIDNSVILEFHNARHPVVERRLEEAGLGRFIPNSIHLDAEHGPSILLITGPNMGGKSTYLRQAALLVILAQCGCFVPAEKMQLGIVDRIYTRIGASDNVARGRSTFMVEMTETAAILNTATNRSLVLLDEMGRGTATYDGLSLAWATVEHLHDRIGARTLFATHYHELTLLGDKLERLQNARVTVKEIPTGIVFLHAVEAGPASKSYGIEVARLAGLPQAVISRAREVLRLHERAENQQLSEASTREQTLPMQMTMFTPLSQKIVDRIAEVDVDGLTPREALNLLADLQRELKA